MDGMRFMQRILAQPALKSAINFWFPAGYSDRVRALAIPTLRNYLTTGMAARLIELSGWTRDLVYHHKLNPGIDCDRLGRDDAYLTQWIADNVWPSWHISGTCRMGWTPSHPAFDRNPLDLADEAAAGYRCLRHADDRLGQYQHLDHHDRGEDRGRNPRRMSRDGASSAP
jgi:5-(hydroxymethyl)furfural/furfural oxidase